MVRTLALASLSVAWLLSGSATLAGQRLTIPEKVSMGAVMAVSSAPSGRTPSVDMLLQVADVVVIGTIGKSTSYLSADVKEIYTDYDLVDPVFIYQSSVMPTSQPGVLPSLSVTQRGGTVLVNGVSFTQKENGLARLTSGTRGLFILQRVNEKYQIAGRFYGAFHIAGDTLVPLAASSGFAERYRGMNVSQATVEMASILQARCRPSQK